MSSRTGGSENTDQLPLAAVGLAAFSLKGVAPSEISPQDIYRALWPFMLMQIAAMLLVMIFPEIALLLPRVIVGGGRLNRNSCHPRRPCRLFGGPRFAVARSQRMAYHDGAKPLFRQFSPIQIGEQIHQEIVNPAKEGLRESWSRYKNVVRRYFWVKEHFRHRFVQIAHATTFALMVQRRHNPMLMEHCAPCAIEICSR
jgi:hypothetical protein